MGIVENILRPIVMPNPVLQKSCIIASRKIPVRWWQLKMCLGTLVLELRKSKFNIVVVSESNLVLLLCIKMLVLTVGSGVFLQDSQCAVTPDSDIGSDAFNSQFRMSPNMIVKRLCPQCLLQLGLPTNVCPHDQHAYVVRSFLLQFWCF